MGRRLENPVVTLGSVAAAPGETGRGPEGWEAPVWGGDLIAGEDISYCPECVPFLGFRDVSPDVTI